MFISARSENVVYVCALQFPLGEAVQQNSCISLHILLLLSNMHISGFSSLAGLDSRLKFEVVLSGFLVAYIVFSRKERAKGISPAQKDWQSMLSVMQCRVSLVLPIGIAVKNVWRLAGATSLETGPKYTVYWLSFCCFWTVRAAFHFLQCSNITKSHVLSNGGFWDLGLL